MHGRSVADEALAEEKKSGGVDKVQGPETFVRTLEYVKDKFANTSTQKMSIEKIINNVKESYGSKR